MALAWYGGGRSRPSRSASAGRWAPGLRVAKPEVLLAGEVLPLREVVQVQGDFHASAQHVGGETNSALLSTWLKIRDAIGVRISSASCPRRPAHRASRTTPRSSSCGMSRSARTAPQAPAPLSGRGLPSTWGATRPTGLEQRQSRSVRAVVAGELEQAPGRVGHRSCVGGGRGRGRTRRQRGAAGWRWWRPASQPASSAGRLPRRSLSASLRNRPVSSLTPRNRDPPPSRPAARAPWMASGALSQVSRAAMAVGVNPWSARATRTASNMRGLAGRGLAQGDQPVGEVAEADLADEVVGQVLAHQADGFDGRDSERRRVALGSVGSGSCGPPVVPPAWGLEGLLGEPVADASPSASSAGGARS